MNRRAFLQLAVNGIALGLASTAWSDRPLYGPHQWHDLRYEDKVWRIEDRAFKDLDQNVKEECKPWLQKKVVWEASFGHVRLPPTKDDGWGWEWEPDSTGHVKRRYVADFSQLWEGDFVQMWWRTSKGTTPHTFLVIDAGYADKLRVIESNVVATNTVGTRWIMFDELRRTLVYWSAYAVA